MKHEDPRGLEPCSLSAHCLRLVDDLDTPGASQQPELVSFIDNIQDERLLNQLRIHVPHCPTCTAIVAQARRVRSQQRAALQELLMESEARVPSTRAQIFAALHQEPKAVSPSVPKRMRYYLQEIVVAPDVQKLNGNHQHAVETQAGRTRLFLRNAFTLATVATLILAAIGVFGHFFVRPGTTQTSNTSNTSINNHGWDAVVVGLTVLSTTSGVAKSITTIYNYNPLSKTREQLVPSFTASDIQLDSIPRDGDNLLYQYSSSGHMQYSNLRQAPNTGFFYQLNDTHGNAGNAVWMDSNHVFIAGGEDGVLEVDISTGTVVQQFPVPKTVRLAFYRAPYLYFVTGLPIQHGVWPALYRINIAVTNDQLHKVSLRSAGSIFWLSPDGTTVFYLNKGPDGEQGIYEVDSDGNNSRVLHKGDVTPIGYAENNALMFMLFANGKFQVVQMGATPKQQERVVLADAAPGASSLCNPEHNAIMGAICDANVALAPYGHELVLDAYYPGGKHKLLFDNLATGRWSELMPQLDGNTQVQLPGWDKMAA